MGWALYLPEEWCKDAERRKKAKIPEQVEFQTKPQLGVGSGQQAAGWTIDRGAGARRPPRTAITRSYAPSFTARGIEYVLSIYPETTIFTAETEFTAPDRAPGRAGATHPRPTAPRSSVS